MMFWVDWYLSQAFMINIKGARAILLKNYTLFGSVQIDWFTTYQDLPRYSSFTTYLDKCIGWLIKSILYVDFWTFDFKFYHYLRNFKIEIFGNLTILCIRTLDFCLSVWIMDVEK